MPKRSHEDDDFFDILSLENEKVTVKRSIFNEYPDLTENGKSTVVIKTDFQFYICRSTEMSIHNTIFG